MKNTLKLLISVLLITALLLPGMSISAEEDGKLFITEICFDTTNKNSSEYLEYIEAVNISDEPVDVRGGKVTYDSKYNSILSYATQPIQPGGVAVFVIYGTGENKDGLKYDTEADFMNMITVFNDRYGCSLDRESFYLIPKLESGTTTAIDNAFNLGNSGTHSIAILSSTGEKLSIDTSYDGTKYDKGGFSVSYSLLDDGTSHMLGTTETEPGRIVESRINKRDLNEYPETIRFMDYNMNVAGCGTDNPEDVVIDECLMISERCGTMFNMISSFDPDILVMTEFNATWWKHFDEYLKNDGSKYACFGHSDLDHNYDAMNEANIWDCMNIIVYNKEKYEMTESGTLWHGTKPDRICYDMTTKEYHIRLHAPNSINWAKFRDKTTGAEFGVIAIHPFANAEGFYELNKASFPDLTKAQFGALARKVSAQILIPYFKENLMIDVPFIISGDFNSKENAEAYDMYLAAGFEDARNLDRYAEYIDSCTGQEAEVYETEDQYFIYKDLPIDHILVAENEFTATGYYVDDTRHNEKYFPSDHLAVEAILHMKPRTIDSFKLVDGSSYTKDDNYIYFSTPEETKKAMLKNLAFPHRLETDVSDIVATGKIIWYKYDVNDIRTFILRGDLSGDGRYTSVDYLKLRQFFKGGELTPTQVKAADYDGNGSVLSADYLKLKSFFKGA